MTRSTAEAAPLRVLEVIAASAAGGAEHAFHTLLRHLPPHRIEPIVACDAGGPMVPRFRSAASAIIELPLSFPTHVESIAPLRRFIRQQRPALVHTHLWNADFLAGLAARLEGVPLVATVHGFYFPEIDPRAAVRARRAALSRAFRVAYRWSTRVIAVSQAVADDLVRRPGLRVPQERIDVIRNGLDLVELESSLAGADWPANLPPRSTLRIGVVANLVPVKGHDTLIDALPAVVAQHPDVQVLFVGDGPDRLRLESRVRDADLTRHVMFTGSLGSALRVIEDADLLVLPSHAEGLGMVLLEAMALGTPVIASRAGGIPEVVEHGRTGLLVPPGDAPALGAAMLRLIGNPDERRRLAAAAKREVETRWSAQTMAARTADVYRRVLDARPVT